MADHPIITIEQARADGWTASQMRTIARTLDRLSSASYSIHDAEKRIINRINAGKLRRLAKEI